VLLHDFGQRIDTTTEHTEALQAAINSYDLDSVSAACGGDVHPYNETIGKMRNSLQMLLANVEDAKNMTSCATVRPIFRSVVHGTACSDSVEGLSCLLGTACGMLILGMIMVSTRAALYNPIIRPRRRKRREREFKEYVEYMGSFYDTADWKLEPAAKAGEQAPIQPAQTFETTGSDESASPRSIQQDASNEYDDSSHVDEHEADNIVASVPESGCISPPRKRRLSYQPTLSTVPPQSADEDPDVEYYSSDSEDEASTGGETNISALVSRFFVVQRQSHNDQSFSSEADSSVLNRSFMSLLGPAIDFLTPIRKKTATKSENDNDGAPFDESFAVQDDLSSAIESPMPSPDQCNKRARVSAPQKQHRSLLRTNGSRNAGASRMDVV
jgi:hypothetical protein